MASRLTKCYHLWWVCLRLSLKLSCGFGNSLGNLPKRIQLPLKDSTVPGEDLSGILREAAQKPGNHGVGDPKVGFWPHRHPLDTEGLSCFHVWDPAILSFLLVHPCHCFLVNYRAPLHPPRAKRIINTHHVIFQVTAGGSFSKASSGFSVFRISLRIGLHNNTPHTYQV